MPTLTVAVDQIDVTCLPHNVADPAWITRDAEGHVHGMIDGEYPTLKRKHKTVRYMEDGYPEEHTEHWYVCRRCKARVVPGTMAGPSGPQFIPGMTHYYIDEREVTKEEAEAFAVAQGLT